jgi:hypothetical protein
MTGAGSQRDSIVCTVDRTRASLGAAAPTTVAASSPVPVVLVPRTARIGGRRGFVALGTARI